MDDALICFEAFNTSFVPLRFQVLVEIAEGLRTLRALPSGLSGVNLPVFVQAGAAAVHLVTLPARILLCYNVHFHVSNEVVTGIKDSPTLVALEGLAVNR